MYLGIPELRLLFAEICKMEKMRFCYKQHYLLWTLIFMTGVRPGSVVISSAYRNTMQCLLWEDIQFVRDVDRSGVSVLITFKWVKGSRRPTRDGDTNSKPPQFFISPCRDAINVVADPTWMLLQLAVERGLFTQSYQDLLESPEFILSQDPVVTKEPVFIRQPNNVIREAGLGEILPMCTSAVPRMLQRMLQAVGIASKDASPYAFRRECITAIGRNISKEAAQQAAGHHTGEPWEAYDFGFGDLDITPFRLEEGMPKNSRNQLRQILASPAITSRKAYSIHDCNAWIREQLKQNEVLVSFGELIRELQDAVTELEHSVDNAYELPESLDVNDPKSWRENVPEEMFIPAYFGALQKASKKAREWTRKNLRLVFNEEWASTVPVPDRSEVIARFQEAKELPVILRQGDDDGGDAFESRELQPAFQDAIASFDGPVGLLMPGENEEALPDEESADLVRARCYKVWEEMKDGPGGPQYCFLCLADPFGLRTVYDNAGRVNHHIEGQRCEHAGTWDPMEKYIDGLLQEDGLYKCRAPSELPEATGNGSTTIKGTRKKGNICGQKGIPRIPMRGHMRVHHMELLQRLSV